MRQIDKYFEGRHKGVAQHNSRTVLWRVRIVGRIQTDFGVAQLVQLDQRVDRLAAIVMQNVVLVLLVQLGHIFEDPETAFDLSQLVQQHIGPFDHVVGDLVATVANRFHDVLEAAQLAQLLLEPFARPLRCQRE